MPSRGLAAAADLTSVRLNAAILGLARLSPDPIGFRRAMPSPLLFRRPPFPRATPPCDCYTRSADGIVSACGPRRASPLVGHRQPKANFVAWWTRKQCGPGGWSPGPHCSGQDVLARKAVSDAGGGRRRGPRDPRRVVPEMLAPEPR